MARGGFISPAVFLTRAHSRNIATADARDAVIEALRLGTLLCRARRQAGKLQDAAIVPEATWSRLSERQIALWDWGRGDFQSLDDGRIKWTLREVKLKESECNKILDRLASRLPKAMPDHSSLDPVERRRGATWDDWVAEIATLAYEHRIDANSTDGEIIRQAAARLGILHEPEKQTKRMKSAAIAIVARWRIAPPSEPSPTK